MPNYKFTDGHIPGRNKLSVLVQSRYTSYILFLAVMFAKLAFLHGGLHAANIDMNRLDKLIAVGSLMLLSFWVFWLPKRGMAAALLCLNVLLTLLIYADIVYYRYFQDFITVPVLMQAGQMGDLEESIFALLQRSDLFLFADWMLLLGLGILLLISRFQTWRKSSSNVNSKANSNATDHTSHKPQLASHTTRFPGLLRRSGNGLAALMLGSMLTFGPIYSYATTWARELFTGNWWSLAMYNVTGLIGFHGYDAYQYAKDHLGPQPVLTEKETSAINLWFDQQHSAPGTLNDSFGKYSGSNIIVIQVEAFMNFVIGRSVGGQEITPNFNALMKESLYFSNYYHQTAQGRTSDADFASHASLYPLLSGSVFVRYPDHKFDVLPAILKDKGYSTSAFHAYEGSFWNRHMMYKAMGYDHFFSKKDYTLDEPLGWSLGDKSFLRQSLDIIEDTKPAQQPLYAFMTTLSSHHPYSLPASMQELDTGEFNGTIFGDYLQSIHYTDAALGEMVKDMKRRGLWENTIFAVYGDHDNSIKESAYYEQFLGTKLSALDMHQILHQVPLLIHLPDADAGINIPAIDTKPAGQLDLSPSLLHLLGISRGAYHMMGNDLFSGQERLVTLRSGAFTDAELAYIPGEDGQFRSGTCYSLESRDSVDIQLCSSGFEESRNRLQISDNIMKFDALRTLAADPKSQR